MELKTQVKTIKNAPKVKFNIDKPKEKELWVNGLKKIITRNTISGYEIGNYKCVKCGNEQSFNHKPTDLEKWCKCGGRLDYKDKIKKSQVEEIISRQTAYVCNKCGKVYRYPVDCCIAKHKLTQGEILEYNIRRPIWQRPVLS